MITHLLFFILVLLLVGLAPYEAVEKTPLFPFFFLKIFLSYVFLLFTIFLQTRFFKQMREHLYVLVQVEILLFLFLYYFYFNASSVLAAFFPIFRLQSLSIFLPLLLYLGATAFYYIISYKNRFRYAISHIKILIPFALPILTFSILTDFAYFLGLDPFSNTWVSIILLGICIIFLATLLPPTICRLWECKELDDESLRKRLNLICQKAHFSYAGLKTWPLLHFTPTAAILGITSKFRYILFTPSLLHHLSPHAIEAVLAHEIGHSKYKHLLFFPFLLLGMFLFAAVVLQGIIRIFPLLDVPIFIFFLSAGLIALFFRYVIGFFSRLFERQADLYGMQIGVPVKDTIEALDTIGIHTGNSHKIPNWHHFSLYERIEFLKKVEKNPVIAIKFHRYVFVMQFIFIILLVTAFLYFYM